jgi:hypothetical protein
MSFVGLIERTKKKMIIILNLISISYIIVKIPPLILLHD